MCLSSRFSSDYWGHKHQENTPQEGKVAGRKVFVDFNFGTEIAGKNKRHLIGVWRPGSREQSQSN